MMLVLQAYALLAYGLDAAFGWNYGYMLHKPEGASLYDYLGPWPWYLLSLEAIGLVNFWLLDLPFRVLGRARAFAKAEALRGKVSHEIGLEESRERRRG